LKQIDPEPETGVQNLTDEATGKLIPNNELSKRVNNYFAGIGRNLGSKFPQLGHEEKKYFPPLNKASYELEEATSEEIAFRTNDIADHKSSGIKDISTRLFKDARKALLTEFTHLYNLVITTGIFPEHWKIAMVIPKVGNPKNCGDLIPILILPFPGK
jgi:hypothetical protein